MKIVEVKHPLVKHKLGLMREHDISTKRFRELASEVGSLLTYEATADLETEKVTIEGWNGPVEVEQIKGKKITVVPILRAGLGMMEGVLEHVPSARISVVGIYRNEETLEPVPYFQKLVSNIDERMALVVDPMLATGGSTHHTMHLVAMARAAGILINWDDFSDISSVVPLMARLYPNGPADINHFQAAGGVPVLMRELLKGGLLHEDVHTVAGFGLSRYTLEPWLNNGELDWREGATAPLDDQVIATFEKPFSRHGGTKVLSGNLGRAVMKTSAVPVENQVIEAPAVVFESQHDVLPAFEAGLLDKDCVVVVRHQGPKANGMPELHKLMPPLGVLLDRRFKIALVTDGRLSGASGKVPSAIHVTPEAYDGGLLAKVRDGDLIRVNGQTGELTLLVDEAELAARQPHIPDLSASRVGTGREMFGALREKLSGAEQGATCITF